MALTGCTLLGTVLGKPFVRSHRAGQDFILHCKASPQKYKNSFWRNPAWCLQNHWLLWGAKLSFPLYVLCWLPPATLCQVTPPQPDWGSPNCCGGQLYWKSHSKCNICSLLPFVCFLFPPSARSSCSLCCDCDIGADNQANASHTHAPSKPDIRYLEINSVKRFGKVTLHAKTFKRHLGSSKSLNSFSF